MPGIDWDFYGSRWERWMENESIEIDHKWQRDMRNQNLSR